MAKEHVHKNTNKVTTEDDAIKSDPETLNTTDPQEHMEGPLSSLMRKVGDSFESEETKEEVEKKRTNNT